jgi:RNA polymerase sigma-70 factor (sigma-E family)
MGEQDDESFREFVATGSAALLRVAYLLVGDLGQAEDLLQSALVKTYLAWGRIRDPGAVHAYVRRVLVTTATSWWRRRAAHEVPVAAPPELVAPDFAGRQAEAETMRRLLLTLPAKQRAVLVLRFYEDLTEAEVAEVLGVTRGTVSRYVTRGLAALRARLDEGELVR